MSTDTIPTETLTTAQAAEHLGLRTATVSDLVSQGFIKGWRVKPKRFLLEPNSVQAFGDLTRWALAPSPAEVATVEPEDTEPQDTSDTAETNGEAQVTHSEIIHP